MARMVRDAKLDSRTARAALTVRNAPYWRSISKGRSIGYRKGKRGGSWLARYRSKGGERFQIQLGPADDVLDHEANAVLTFEQAQSKAREWFGDLEANQGQRLVRFTVSEALDDYLDGFTGRSRDKTRWTVERYVRGPMGKWLVRDLTTDMIARFHRDLAEAPANYRPKKDGSRKLRPTSSDPRSRRASANRVLTVLKAALNRAFYNGRITSDLAWRRVKPFPGTDNPRIRYLASDEVHRVINAAHAWFRPLIQAALLTGGRWSEVHQIKAADVDLTAGALHFPMTKSGKPRWVHLSDEGIAFFRRQMIGKGREELLFLNQNGRPFGRSHQIRPMREACEAAKVDPVGFHILRHTYGTRLAMAGVPMAVIAEALGHADERITRKHYAHLLPSYVRDAVRAGLGNMGVYAEDGLAYVRTV